MAELKTMYPSSAEKILAAAQALADESPDLVQAYIDFRRERASGTVEIHFSQGGIAKVFGKIARTYK